MDTMLPSAVIVDVLVVIAVMVVVGIVQLAVVNWINQLTKKIKITGVNSNMNVIIWHSY